jgi:N-methylhydantoinase B/oxoprolinase/acetone carboxylase alpha subunit
VFWEGQLTGFVSVKAHWSDVGGPVPSSMQVGSREFRQEGLRFQSVRLFSRGELNDEVMRMIRGNIRTESGTLKDVPGHDRRVPHRRGVVHEILAKYGRRPCSRPRASTWSSRSGARGGAWPRSRPAPTGPRGRSTTTASRSDRPVRVAMAITVGDGAMTVDFAGSDAQVAGPFNCGDAITISACRLLIKCLTTPHDLVDEGCFRPLRVVISPPLGAGRRGAGADSALLRADQPADRAGAARAGARHPDRVPAGAYGDQMPTIAFGTHPETGRLFIQGDLNAGGTGARRPSTASRR